MSFNPMFSLHFRLSGSWRNNAIIAGAFAALVIGGATLTYQLAGSPNAGNVSSAWLGIVTAAQGLFALLIASGAIRRAVLRDFQSGMIESHRLTPMSSTKIVLGYMTGAPVQALWLYVTALLLGTYFASDLVRTLTPAVLPGWYLVQVCLLCVAFMLAALVLLIAFNSAGRTNIITAVVIFTVLGGWVAIAFVPGIALVTGVLSGGVLLKAFFQGGPTGVSGSAQSILYGIAVQLAFGIILLRAASQKIRAPDQAMFSIPLGLLLVLVWAVTLIAGVAMTPPSHWLVQEYGDIAAAQLIVSTAAFMLMALFPLVAAANERYRLDQTAKFGAPVSPARRRLTSLIPILLGALSVAVLVLMRELMDEQHQPYFGGTPTDETTYANSLSLGLAIMAALILSFWINFNWVYRAIARGKKVLKALLISVGVFHALPLVADMSLLAASEEIPNMFQESVGFADLYFAGFSPIGTMILCFSENGNPWPGLAGQLLLAIGVTMLGHRARRQTRS